MTLAAAHTGSSLGGVLVAERPAGLESKQSCAASSGSTLGSAPGNLSLLLDTPPTITQAHVLLDRMAAAGQLPPAQVDDARQALTYLYLWGGPPPTDLSDGSDGDFSLMWRNGPQAASLSFGADEVLGYSFKPSMLKPWMFEDARIGISELNTFIRTLG